MQNINQLIERLGIQMTAEPTDHNPQMIDDDWARAASHYQCVLSRGELGADYSELITVFSMGPAHTEPPTVAAVLDCLASDAAGYENAQTFEDWASEYGYDTDSRRAEHIYEAVEKAAAELREFMQDEYDDLLWNTSRQ